MADEVPNTRPPNSPSETEEQLLASLRALGESVATAIFKMQQDLKEAIDGAMAAARKDHKTPLSNERALAEWSQKPLAEGVTIFSGDINDFKSINDKYGYDTADTIIYDVGCKLHTIAKELTDTTAFRRGGDEFVVITSNPRVKKEIIAELDNFCFDIQTTRPTPTINVTVVFGEAKLRANESLHDALARADLACKAAKWRYRANQSEGNVVEWTPQIASGTSERAYCLSCGSGYNVAIPPGKNIPPQGTCWICQSDIGLCNNTPARED